MKLAMCNEFCDGWSFDQACELAALAGYDGIEIAPFTLAPNVNDITWQQRQDLRTTAESAGLQVVGLHWLLVGPDGLHLSSPDPGVRERTVRYLQAQADLCADLGGETLVFGSPKQRGLLPGQAYQDVWDRSVQAFRRLAEHAQSRNVRVCVEPLGPSETTFINTAVQARKLVNAVDRPGFRMMLDVKAMAEDSEPPDRIIRKCASYLAHFHANDANRRGPGFGDTDFAPIAAALKEIRYEGYVSVEVFDFSAGPERTACRSIEYLRSVFDRT